MTIEKRGGVTVSFFLSQEETTTMKALLAAIAILCTANAFAVIYYVEYLEPAYEEPSVEKKVVIDTSQTEAKEIAQQYLEINPYSRQGLENELVDREKINRETARSAIASIDEDWGENAKEEAENITEIKGYTKDDIERILKAEGYTDNEIKKAIAP